MIDHRGDHTIKIGAAVWANEPFGWREVTGSALILVAGIIEVVLSQKSAAAPTA